MKALDLFCGAGGLSCGLKMEGIRTVLAIDKDRDAVNTFQLNNTKSQSIVGDLSKMTVTEIKDLIGKEKIDIICGSPPCQGYSVQGKQDVDDPRNILFKDFVRIVEGINPKYIVMENVTGLLNKKNKVFFDEIVKGFSRIGYSVEMRVLLAEEYGVPQKRRRVFFIGNKVGMKNIFPIPSFLSSSYLVDEQSRMFVQGELFSLVKYSSLPLPRTFDWAATNLVSCEGEIFNHDVVSAANFGERQKGRVASLLEGVTISSREDQEKFLPMKYWYPSSKWEGRKQVTVLRRLSRTTCSPTILTKKNRYIHPVEDRYLTVREAAAIQSFPANYIFTGSEFQQWKQVGNAVPPLLAKAIGYSLNLLEHKYNPF